MFSLTIRNNTLNVSNPQFEHYISEKAFEQKVAFHVKRSYYNNSSKQTMDIPHSFPIYTNLAAAARD